MDTLKPSRVSLSRYHRMYWLCPQSYHPECVYVHMCVCACICMCMCVCLCMYICMCLYMYVHICMCLYKYVNTHVCLGMCTMCGHTCAYVYACLHVCKHVCACACLGGTCVCRSCRCFFKVNCKCFSRTVSLTDLELTKWVMLAGQWVPEIYLVPSPHFWKVTSLHVQQFFSVGSGVQTQVLVLIWQALYWLSYFPTPHTDLSQKVIGWLASQALLSKLTNSLAKEVNATVDTNLKSKNSQGGSVGSRCTRNTGSPETTRYPCLNCVQASFKSRCNRAVVNPSHQLWHPKQWAVKTKEFHF